MSAAAAESVSVGGSARGLLFRCAACSPAAVVQVSPLMWGGDAKPVRGRAAAAVLQPPSDANFALRAGRTRGFGSGAATWHMLPRPMHRTAATECSAGHCPVSGGDGGGYCVQVYARAVLDATGHARRLVEFDSDFTPGYQAWHVAPCVSAA